MRQVMLRLASWSLFLVHSLHRVVQFMKTILLASTPASCLPRPASSRPLAFFPRVVSIHVSGWLSFYSGHQEEQSTLPL
ncbi:hypothetical protein IWX90DRAFT_240144 [Phyllosticta citrichinensis]|uniref:Secreted protein n=1 Tax=Phyllosticta citrichinensis TaxID=1130410 RepID=A0ABR1XQ36_9PEZI